MAKKEAQENQDMEGTEGRETSEEQRSVNLHDLPEFRDYQSRQDRRIAQMEQRNEELQEQLEQMIDDPEQRQEFRNKRLRQKLEKYEQQEQVEKQRRTMAERWNIPVDVLSEVNDPRRMTTVALDYLSEQAQGREKEEQREKKEEDLKQAEREGADDVSAVQSTPPSEQQVNQSEIDERIDELRKTARGRGVKASQARVEILKLEAQRNTGKTKEAQL